MSIKYIAWWKVVVSILVLMDITLLLYCDECLELGQYGFNPCFNGYYTSTILFYYKTFYPSLVSILVLMDITLLRDSVENIQLNILEFQSLF